MRAFLLSLLFYSFITVVAQTQDDFPGGRGEKTNNGKSVVYEFKNGQYTSYRDENVYVKGTYITKGKYLIVTDESGSGACINDGIEVGIYTWEYYHDKVRLKVVDDDCLGRQRGFLLVTLSKSN